MHKRNALAAMLDRIFDSCPDETLGAFRGYRLDADARRLREADLAYTNFIL
ncbi:hypothetical protein D3C71_1851160 [compost metagenome]